MMQMMFYIIKILMFTEKNMLVIKIIQKAYTVWTKIKRT